MARSVCSLVGLIPRRRQSPSVVRLSADGSVLRAYRADSSRCCGKFQNAGDVVGGDGQAEHPADQGDAAVAGHRRDPAEYFLDPFADSRVHRIAGMPSRPSVDSGAAPGSVLRPGGGRSPSLSFRSRMNFFTAAGYDPE